MNTNGFRNEEVVQIQGRPRPTVAGRLRQAHENNDKLSVRTEVIHFVLGVEAVVRCEVTTCKGIFSATGVATATRDGQLVDALVEVAETRSLARSLRWAGYGMEVGAEELDAAHGIPAAPTSPVPLHHRNGNARGARSERTGPPASTAQLRCIRTLARRLGRDAEDAIGQIVPGVDLAHLTLPDASRVIDRLKVAAGNGHRTGEGRTP